MRSVVNLYFFKVCGISINLNRVTEFLDFTKFNKLLNLRNWFKRIFPASIFMADSGKDHKIKTVFSIKSVKTF